jgi:hypothetical protein
VKGLAIPAYVICLALMSLPACAPAPEPEADLRAEEQALREFLEEVLVAYENRDGKAMAAMCDETFMNLGGVLRGRENIERFWETFLGSLGDTQLNILEEVVLEFVAERNPQPPQQFFAANIYVKKDARWLRKGAFLRPITAAELIE